MLIFILKGGGGFVSRDILVFTPVDWTSGWKDKAREFSVSTGTAAGAGAGTHIDIDNLISK